MKYGLILGLLAMLCAAGIAPAADRQPGRAKLSKLGLSSMKVVSDQQGASVRGSGFVTLGGFFQVSNGVATQFVPGPINVSPNFASFGTRNPITNVNTPVMLVSPIIINGLPGTTTAFASGTVFAFAL